MPLTSRLATSDDIPALEQVMQAAIDDLQKGYLDEAQIRSSHAIMGIDHQLIDDATCFVIELDGQLAGCGGWSRRAMLYGGDHSAARRPAALRGGRVPDHGAHRGRVRRRAGPADEDEKAHLMNLDPAGNERRPALRRGVPSKGGGGRHCPGVRGTPFRCLLRAFPTESDLGNRFGRSAGYVPGAIPS
jgi:hypothetical protein